jgi:hypothetical protein
MRGKEVARAAQEFARRVAILLLVKSTEYRFIYTSCLFLFNPER